MLVQKADYSRDACPLTASTSRGQSKTRKRSVAAHKRPNGKAQKGMSRLTPSAASSAGAASTAAAVQSPSPHAQQSSDDTASRSASPLPTESADSPASGSPMESLPPPPPGVTAWCAHIAKEVRPSAHHFKRPIDRRDLYTSTVHVRVSLVSKHISFLASVYLVVEQQGQQFLLADIHVSWRTFPCTLVM